MTDMTINTTTTTTTFAGKLRCMIREMFGWSCTAGFFSSIAIQWLDKSDFWFLPVGTVMLMAIGVFGLAILGTLALGFRSLIVD